MISSGSVIRIILTGIYLLGLCLSGSSARATSAAMTEANALFKEGWYDDARTLLEGSSGDSVKDPEFTYLLGKLCFVQGDLKEAEKLLERVVKDAPDNAEYQRWYGHAMGRRAQEGSKFKALGRAKKCRRAYERAAELEPSNPAMQFPLMGFLMQAPGFIGGDKQRAEAIAEQILALDAVQGHLARAKIAERVAEDLFAAEVHARRAMAADPTNSKAHFRLADILLKRGEDERAEAIYLELTGVDSLAVQAHFQLANAYQTAERFPEALAQYERIREIDPANCNALYQIGRTEISANGDLARAEECLRTYLESKLKGWWPSRAEAHWQLAMIYEMQGDDARALAEVEKSLDADPKFKEAQKLYAKLDDGLDDF